MASSKIVLSGEDLTLEDVLSVARDYAPVEIALGALRKVQRCRAVVDKLLAARAVVYGLTTGFGSLRDILIEPEKVQQLQQNLIRSHSCGVGSPAPEVVTRAMMLLRANTLAKGYSGVRPLIIETLVQMLNKLIYPVVPMKGSVGASGDLAPLSHMVLVMMGEGEAFLADGLKVSGKEAMQAAGIPPVVLEAKEGLALNNGTQFMAAVGTVALLDAEYLARVATIACALSLEAIKGVPRAFDPRIHEVRAHPGQTIVAREIRHQIEQSEILALPVNTARLHSTLTFLKEAEEVLKREKGERCQTAADGIHRLRSEITKMMDSLQQRISEKVTNIVRQRLVNEEPPEEIQRQAGAELLSESISSVQGILEQVLSGSLPQEARQARKFLMQALDEIQKAVPLFVPVQDDYSFRCSPQVMGSALDTFLHVRNVLAREVNSATDNPLIFPPPVQVDNEGMESYVAALSVAECKQAVVSGGNFHGEPIAIAMDHACIALAEIGSISERRTFHLVSRHLSNGLPSFIIPDVGLQSGLMIAQYTAAALVSENKVLSHPASTDSIPTCEDAEDHVSMGAHAARKFADVVENVYQILAIELICAAQGVELRKPASPSPLNQELCHEIRRFCPVLIKDRTLGADIERVAEALRNRKLRSLMILGKESN